MNSEKLLFLSLCVSLFFFLTSESYFHKDLRNVVVH